MIFDDKMFGLLVDNPYPNLALVAKYESWMDGTVVTLDKDQKITRFIDKSGFDFSEIHKYYKTVNIYKFSKEFSAKYYVPFLTAYSTALGDNEYYEQVLRVILHLRNAPLFALSLSGDLWYEIDDMQDLDIASGMFASTEEDHYKAYMKRYGGYWRYPQMLDFCYLVNPYFPPKRMIDEIKASFETLMREYPSGMYVNSLLAAKNFSVKQDYIVVGNGAAELIKCLMENWAGKLGNILPTFEEYPNRLEADNIVQYVPSKEGFKYSADDVMYYFKDNPDHLKDLPSVVKMDGKKYYYLDASKKWEDIKVSKYYTARLKKKSEWNKREKKYRAFYKKYNVSKVESVFCFENSKLQDIEEQHPIGNYNGPICVMQVIVDSGDKCDVKLQFETDYIEEGKAEKLRFCGIWFGKDYFKF